MYKQSDIDKARDLLRDGQDYIINCDLDGLICGLLVANYTHGRIVGFSRCNGKQEDALWYDKNVVNAVDINSFKDVVFVDLPVVVPGLRMIDQHFIALNDDDIAWLFTDDDKLNPNVIEGYTLSGDKYTSKFPFGSCHFIIALLERLGVKVAIDYNMPTNYKNLPFLPSDLIYRADRCVGNAGKYTDNCKKWAAWLEALGKSTTARLFVCLFSSGLDKKEREVEKYLQQTLGATSPDGDFTSMIENGDWKKFDAYQKAVADILGWKPMNISYDSICKYPNLTGEKSWPSIAVETLPKNDPSDRIFSRTITDKHTVSVTKY